MHPKAISISELTNRVNNYASDCVDGLGQTKTFTFQDRILSYQDGEPGSLFGTQGMLGSMSRWAFAQVAGRLDAPGMDWLGDDKHCSSELRTMILNKLVEEREDTRLFIRHKGETIRAVLSDEYTKFDNIKLVEFAASAIEKMRTDFLQHQGVSLDVEVHRAEVGDELRAYIMIPNITFGDEPGNSNGPAGGGGLHPAVYIRNSERGGGSVKITGGVYRTICGNGIIMGWNATDLFTVRHRWIQEAGMAELVGEGLAVALKMSEQAAVAFMNSIDKTLTPKSLDPIIADWAGKYGLSVDVKKQWLDVTKAEAISYGRSTEPRLFDLVNAATLLAQSQDADQRELMERMAGDLLVSDQPLRGRNRLPMLSEE